MITATTRALIKLLRDYINENTVLSAGSIVEISKLPVIVLNGPVLRKKLRLNRPAEKITVIDSENNQAIKSKSPSWVDLIFNVNFTCESNIELLEMIADFINLSRNIPLIKAENERKREYTWNWRNMPSNAVSPNVSQVYQGNGEIIIYDVEIYNDLAQNEIYSLIEEVSIKINEVKS